MPKIFVLDTNVLLHDYRSLYKFQDNDIVIPLVDLEEIDHFKKGNDQINFNAREIMRSLDKLAGKGLFEEGIQLGRNMGKLSVVIGKGLTQAMKEAAMEDIPDHPTIVSWRWLWICRRNTPNAMSAWFPRISICG